MKRLHWLAWGLALACLVFSPAIQAEESGSADKKDESLKDNMHRSGQRLQKKIEHGLGEDGAWGKTKAAMRRSQKNIEKKIVGTPKTGPTPAPSP